MSESSLKVILLSSLIYHYFEVNIEQDKIRKALLIKQQTEWFCFLLTISWYFGVILIGGIYLIGASNKCLTA